MSRNEPFVIRSRTAAEFIASLPHIAGMPLRDSVVVVPFWGNRAPSVIRVDLPADHSRAVARSLASSILGHLARLEGCDSVIVVIFTDEPFAAGFPGRRDLMGHLLDRIHASGFHLTDASIVAVDGWGDFFDDTVDAPRSLTEIEAAAPDVPEEYTSRVPVKLPKTDPALAVTVADLFFHRLAFDEDLDAFGRRKQLPLPDPVDFLERALSEDPRAAGAQTLAHLLALLDSEGAVDRTVLQIAFGRTVGADSWRRTLSVRRRAAEAGVQPMEILHQDHESGTGDDGDTLGRMLVGDWPEQPSAARLEIATALLGRAIAHCPREDRAWAMCALAWVHWALGRTSAAADLLVTAAEIDPHNSLVPVHYTVVTRFLPSWIFVRAEMVATGAPAQNRATRRRAKRTGRA